MQHRTIKYGFLGLLSGSFIYLVFTVFLSLKIGTGDVYLVLPALGKEYGNELLSLIVQIGSFLWLGMACGVAFSIIENMVWTMRQQALGYFIALTIGLLPIALIGKWFKHPMIGIFSYILMLTVISMVLFFITWMKLKRDIVQIKKAVRLQQEEL